MGILDMLPWKKKEDDFLKDVGQGQPDPFAQASSQGQSDSFQDPMQDPLASPQDPLANRDPLTNQGVLDEGTSRFDNSMQDPFAELPSPSQNFAQQPQHSSRSQSRYQESYAQQPSYEQHYSEPPSRDVELILAKLDAIKSELDSVHQRVRKLEQVSDASHTQKYKW